MPCAFLHFYNFDVVLTMATGLGVSYIVNAPSLYSFAWSLLSPFLDAVTKSKIKFVTVSKETVWTGLPQPPVLGYRCHLCG